LPLHCKYHVVLAPQLQAAGAPRFEVSARVDRAARTLVGADRPKLREGSCALNRRLVTTDLGPDFVGIAIRRHIGLLLRFRVVRAWLVSAVTLYDVVLDQGTRRPPVDGQVSVAFGLEGTVKADIPVREEQVQRVLP